MFWRNPKIMFMLGIILGAVILGDDGGDVIMDGFSALREVTSNLFDLIGSGAQDFGSELN